MDNKFSLKDERQKTNFTAKERSVRERTGSSNAGEYPNVASKNFAGNECGLPGAYPINTIERARAALAYAHNAKDPECIRNQVYKKYPILKTN